MSEKGNLIISRHDADSRGCLNNNECVDSNINVFKEPSALSERKYTPTLNEKTSVNSDTTIINDSDNASEMCSISLSSKSTVDQDSIIDNNVSCSFPLQAQVPISSKNNCTENEQISSTTLCNGQIALCSADIINSDLSSVEDWLKARSDSLSSLDFDSELKSAEMDTADFFNVRPSLSNTIFNNVSLDSHQRLSQDMSPVGIYTHESMPSSSGLMLNSLNFESDGSMSSISTNGAFDTPSSKYKVGHVGLNIIKKGDNFAPEKGLFEEMLLSDTLKNKIKDNIIGDEKGLFEELLIPGVQEWLLTVSSADNMKKDLGSTTIIDSVSIPQSPTCISSLSSNNHDESQNKDTFDEYDLIGRNINTLKLMTPQEIENMPSRSLEFDDGQLKSEDATEDNITDLPYVACENKELSELPSSSNTDIDHKLFNILAMDASNDTLDNNPFSENIISSINQENSKEEPISTNLNFNTVFKDKSSGNESNISAVGKPKKEESYKIQNVNNAVNSNSGEVYNLNSDLKDNKAQSLSESFTLTSEGKAIVSSIKIMTKNNHCGSKTQEKISIPQKVKNSPVPISIVQLKSSIPPKTQAVNRKLLTRKNNIQSSFPHVLIKPVSIQSENNVPMLNFNGSSPGSTTTNEVSQNSKPTVQKVSGVAKINIAVDCKANTTNVSIISSNKEHTVFKINTSDLIRAVSSIKESYLEPLGLKNQQLVDTANAAHKLLNIHSHISHIKKSNKDLELENKTPQSFEINQYIQEIKEPVSRLRTTSNIKHVIPTSKNLELSNKKVKVSKPGNIDTNGTNFSKNRKINSKRKVNLTKKSQGENVGISLLPGAPPTMVSVPSVLDALSGPTTSNVNLAQVLASCDLTTPSSKVKTKTTQDNISVSDEKTNNALIQLGINPNTLSPHISPKGNKRWPCPIASCSKQFPKLSYLKVHILNHKGIRPYKCSYDNCDWSFYTSYKLKRHLETHLKRRDFVCTEPDCSRRFTTIYNLNTHLSLHKRPKSWVCSLASCNKAFHTRRELEAHMKLHTDVKPPYKCSVDGCLKAYFTPNSLASHMRSHHKEEDLLCQWVGCGKKFDKPCRLKAHMRVHTGQRPYACNFEGCNWRFQCASKLSRHQRKHTNDRKYSCPICKKAFLRSEHLKGHLLTHTGVRNFQCPMSNCEAKFTAKSSLYVHLKKHKSQKSDVKFHCPFEACDKIYDCKPSLRQHIVQNHSPVITSDVNHLDYITLVGDKDLSEGVLPQSNIASFIPLPIQNSTVENQSVALESTGSGTEKGNINISGGSGESLVVPLLSLTSVPLSAESQNEANILTVPEGFFSFGEGDLSQTNSDFGFPELANKDPPTKRNGKNVMFQGGSAARTDVLGNIILSQRAKKRQQITSNELSKTAFCNDLILASSCGETIPLSSQLQHNVIQDEAISNAMYGDALITSDIVSDPSSEPQSTINLRDLE